MTHCGRSETVDWETEQTTNDAEKIIVNGIRMPGLGVLLILLPALVHGDGHSRLVKKAAKLCTEADFAWEDVRTCSRERGPNHKWCISYRKTALKKDEKCQAARDELDAFALKMRKSRSE